MKVIPNFLILFPIYFLVSIESLHLPQFLHSTQDCLLYLRFTPNSSEILPQFPEERQNFPQVSFILVTEYYSKGVLHNSTKNGEEKPLEPLKPVKYSNPCSIVSVPSKKG